MSSLERLVVANQEAFTQLYDEQGVDYMLNIARGKRRQRFKLDPKQVDERFFEAEETLYHLNGLIAPQLFYQQQLAIVAEVIRDIQRTSLPSNNQFGILVELNIPHTKASERLEQIAGIEQDSSRRIALDLRWQSLVQVVFTHAASLMSAHRMNTGLDDVVSDLHNWLAKRLYSGDKGATHRSYYRTFHDPITNRVLSIAEDEKLAQPPFITREHFSRFRYIGGIGFVYTDPRVKGISAVGKLVDDALSSDGVFQPAGIEDKGGIIAVAIGDRPMRDKLMSRFIELLETYPLKAGPITADDQVDCDRGQSKIEIKRLKFPVSVGGVVEPIEFVFKSLMDYRNQVDEVGGINPITGLLTGQGHDAYEQRRNARLLPVIYPNFIYKPQNFDLARAIWQGSQQLRIYMMGRGLLEANADGGISGINGRVLSIKRWQ